MSLEERGVAEEEINVETEQKKAFYEKPLITSLNMNEETGGNQTIAGS